MKIGFNTTKKSKNYVSFIPISAYSGFNLTKLGTESEDSLSWYENEEGSFEKCPCLLEAIDQITLPQDLLVKEGESQFTRCLVLQRRRMKEMKMKRV